MQTVKRSVADRTEGGGVNSGAQRARGARLHCVVTVDVCHASYAHRCPTPRVNWDKATDLE